MLIPTQEHHFTDGGNRPTGGTTYGRGFAIAWQNGPLRENGEWREPNGAFVESIIAAAMGRLEFYQKGPFSCRENEEAIAHLREALIILGERTREQEERGIEGTHQP